MREDQKKRGRGPAGESSTEGETITVMDVQDLIYGPPFSLEIELRSSHVSGDSICSEERIRGACAVGVFSVMIEMLKVERGGWIFGLIFEGESEILGSCEGLMSSKRTLFNLLILGYIIST